MDHRPAPFSAVSLIVDALSERLATLNRIECERGLSANEFRQLEILEPLHEAARATVPLAFELFVVGSAAPFREAIRRAREAAQPDIPVAELLGMREAVPSGWRHRLPLNIETLLWLGVTRLVDDLSLICAVGVSSPERQEQLEASRRLHAASGRTVELALQASAPDQKVARATARLKAAFASASEIIGAEVAAIRAEAAEIRARRR